MQLTIRILLPLFEESVNFSKGDRLFKSSDLLNFAVKNSFRAPFAYVAPTNRYTITVGLKKISKIKGIEIIELYADNYFKKKKEV